MGSTSEEKKIFPNAYKERKEYYTHIPKSLRKGKSRTEIEVLRQKRYKK